MSASTYWWWGVGECAPVTFQSSEFLPSAIQPSRTFISVGSCTKTVLAYCILRTVLSWTVIRHTQTVATRRKADEWDFFLKPRCGENTARQSSVGSTEVVLAAPLHGEMPAPRQLMGNYVLPALKSLLSFYWDTEIYTYHIAIYPQRLLSFTHFTLYSLYIITLNVFLQFIMLQNKTAI